MSDRNNDRNKDLEIQNILDERRQVADEEKMQQTAQRYRAQPKLVEIFSNTDGKPRLKNESPLDLEKQDNPENVIVGEKTASTMQAQLMMEGSEASETIIAFPASAQEPKPQLFDPDDVIPDNKVITLAPEYAEDTQFAGEVLHEVDTFREPAKIETIDSIDIAIDPGEPTPEPPQEEEPAAEPEPNQEPERVVAKVPVYRPDEPDNLLNVKAGRFSEVVGNEYEEYIRSKRVPAARSIYKPSQPNAEAETDDTSTQEKILGAVVGFFSKDEAEEEDMPKAEKKKPVEDYTGEEDEKSIRFALKENIRKLFFRSVISGAIALVAIVITVITRFFPEGIISVIPVAPAAYAVFNFLLIGSSLILNRVSMGSGLGQLLRLKGNSDTAVAVAGCAALLQTIVSFFFLLGDMSSFSVNYYAAIVLLAFFANNVGKLVLVLRVKDNFRFLTAKGQKYAAKIYNNESVAHKMLSGTLSEKNLIAYQHKTGFAANFLKLSYAPDPSEDLASRLAPATTVIALAVAVLYGILRGSVPEAFNALALISAIAIPVSTLLAVNVPVRRLCKTLNEFGAMTTGYPSIKQFCDSTAIMIDADELFPADVIDLEGIKTFDDYNVDESLLCGIAVLKEAQNPIANAFASVVSETKETLPDVESVLYEDGLGLVGWVNSERILVGSRALLEKYKVKLPVEIDEEKYTGSGRQLTYLSRAGRAVAVLVTRYSADPELKSELQRAEANGISFLIRTTDYNLTDDLIAQLYNLFYRSIKVLPTGLGNALKEAKNVNEEQSRSYLITRGKTSALARAVSGCVRIKHNISMAVIIQLIAVVLGLLTAIPLVLYAGAGVLGSLEVLVYVLFWAVAAIVAPAIQKP